MNSISFLLWKYYVTLPIEISREGYARRMFFAGALKTETAKERDDLCALAQLYIFS